ncbi:unnamed protein product [Protopolystoma xenopodis]|uniref:Uncharacterized protein n=1 Tax=Protopolystoma xenopodis TaxID=117903 RepID=A0A448WHR9_9PLAT|nr:unnamed protein product [Protopolystoma xenopodis]
MLSLHGSSPSLNSFYRSKLWSHAASQVDFWYILAITPNFCDCSFIRLLSSLTARPPKLYCFIQNGHHSLTMSLLDCRKPLPPNLFFAIAFTPVSDGSLIQASPFCWFCSIPVIFEIA